MVSAMPDGWRKSSPGSLLATLSARRARHPDEFACGVRVVEGTVPGESRRWSYRPSAVDPLVPDDGAVGLNHGSTTRLRLRFTGAGRRGSPPVRPHHVVWPATELGSGARVEVAADPGEADRLRVG